MKTDPPCRIGKKCNHIVLRPDMKIKGLFEVCEYEVTLLAVSGIWGMVRRKGAMPYVTRMNELEPLNSQSPWIPVNS